MNGVLVPAPGIAPDPGKIVPPTWVLAPAPVGNTSWAAGSLPTSPEANPEKPAAGMDMAFEVSTCEAELCPKMEQQNAQKKLGRTNP